jgi:hypothetical protein
MNDFLGNLTLRQSQILVFGMIAAFAACFKLAAHLYRRTALTWPNAFLVLGVVLLGSGLLKPFTRGAPLVLGLLVSLVVAVGLGAVTLKLRAKSAEGAPLTNADAAKVSAIGYGFLSLVVAAIGGVIVLAMD